MYFFMLTHINSIYDDAYIFYIINKQFKQHEQKLFIYFYTCNTGVGVHSNSYK